MSVYRPARLIDGHPCCPAHRTEQGEPVRLTYVQLASGERREYWRCPVDDEEFLSEHFVREQREGSQR